MNVWPLLLGLDWEELCVWCGGLVPWLTECELGQSLMILVLYQSAKHQESLYVLHHNQVKEEGDLPEVSREEVPNNR